MMKKCWRYEPEARPTLTDILEEINELLERERYVSHNNETNCSNCALMLVCNKNWPAQFC